MKHRSLSRKEILRRARRPLRAACRRGRQYPLADVQPLIAASRAMRDRPAVCDIPGVSWDAPTRSTPLADILGIREAFMQGGHGTRTQAAVYEETMGVSPLRPAYRIWGPYKAFTDEGHG